MLGKKIMGLGSGGIVGLDIGTSSIRAVVIEQVNNKPVIKRLLKESTFGLRKGTVVDVTEASNAVNKVLGEIRKTSKSALKNIFVNVGTFHSRSQYSRGIIAVSRADNEIFQEDIDRAVKASQAINLGPNRMVVHTVVREFIIDGIGDITEPLGLSGSRLEVNSLIIDSFTPHVKSIMRLIELGGGRIGGLVLDPLAASRGTLTKRQKDLGVVLVDIGFGTTSIAVYEEQKLLGVSIFPIGGGNITHDLAIGLKIPVDVAERVKLTHGFALSREVGSKETIDLGEFTKEADSAIVSKRFVSEIIEARLAEVLELVNNELKSYGRSGQLVGGVVITGGGAKIAGLLDLAKQELKLTPQLGLPSLEVKTEEGGSVPKELQDPDFVGAVGLALYGVDQEEWGSREASSESSSFRFKDLLDYFLP